MTEVLSIDYHRNGISGDSFYVAIIKTDDNDRPLVAIVPSSAVDTRKASPETGLYQCYVIDPALAAAGEIRFGYNSWRGDHYFDAVVDAAKQQEKENEIGPEPDGYRMGDGGNILPTSR